MTLDEALVKIIKNIMTQVRVLIVEPLYKERLKVTSNSLRELKLAMPAEPAEPLKGVTHFNVVNTISPDSNWAQHLMQVIARLICAYSAYLSEKK